MRGRRKPGGLRRHERARLRGGRLLPEGRLRSDRRRRLDGQRRLDGRRRLRNQRLLGRERRSRLGSAPVDRGLPLARVVVVGAGGIGASAVAAHGRTPADVCERGAVAGGHAPNGLGGLVDQATLAGRWGPVGPVCGWRLVRLRLPLAMTDRRERALEFLELALQLAQRVPQLVAHRPSVASEPASRSLRVGGRELRAWSRRAQRTALEVPPSTSTASSATCVGVRPTRTPLASSAFALAAAVPLAPDTIAPAWPICLPAGAVKPAM